MVLKSNLLEKEVENQRMSSGRGNPKQETKIFKNVFSSPSESEIDQLLHQTQDHLLLNLTINSHTTSSSLNPDLSRRFLALKAPKTNPSTNRRKVEPKPSTVDAELRSVVGDDLASRFATLKASSGTINSDSSNGDHSVSRFEKLKGASSEIINSDSSDGDGFASRFEKMKGASSGMKGDYSVDETGCEKSEVDKLLEWAMDEARLNPSSKSDDEDYEGGVISDDNLESSDDDDDDDDDDEEEEEEKKKKGKKVEKEVENSGKGGKGKRWGFF